MAANLDFSIADLFRWDRSFRVTPGCWEWNLYKVPRGYGMFAVKSHMYSAHRVSWMIYNGTIPDNMHICHRCDNPSCVNPDHLWLGTNKDNVDDSVRKGRRFSAAGSLNGFSKLTENDVIRIRAARASGATCKYIAGKFNINLMYVYDIINRRCWKHI